MAREARKLSAAGLYVISLKGGRLFFDDNDRRMFKEISERFFADGGRIFGYSLDDSEIKMVVKESGRGISLTMKSVKVSYARYFNKTHGINGSLFSGRFKSIPLDSEEEAKLAAKQLDEPVKSKKTEEKSVEKSVKKSVKREAENTAVKKPEKPQKYDAEKNGEKKKSSADATADKSTAAASKKPKKKTSLPPWLL